MDDVLVIGEALIDIVSSAGQEPAEHVGGSPANVAIGLSRLGHATSLLTRIGDDERGRTVRAHLEASGVALVPGSVSGAATSTATARIDAKGLADYEFDIDWAIAADAGPGTAKALHTGSLAATMAPGGDVVLHLVEAAAGRCAVSYDPNVRPKLMGPRDKALSRVERIVRSADVVKVSDEDLEWLAPGADPVDVARQWLESGPALVVVTRGPAGAVGVVAGGTASVGAPPIDVVDTVGAGDALMAGLLDGLARAGLLTAGTVDGLRRTRPGDLEPLLTHAVAVAAYTCTRPGADPPTQQQLADWLT